MASVQPVHGSPGDAPQMPAIGPGPDMTPYFAGQVAPVNAMGDDDAGGRDDVSATVAGSVDAANARWHEFQSGTFGLGSTIGDLVDFPPSPLDPGAGVGNTAPTAAFYDPPRGYGGPEGAPGYGGEQGAPGYQGEAQ